MKRLAVEQHSQFGNSLRVHYLPETHEMEISLTVGQAVLTERWRAQAEPVFGLDVVDVHEMHTRANRMCDDAGLPAEERFT